MVLQFFIGIGLVVATSALQIVLGGETFEHLHNWLGRQPMSRARLLWRHFVALTLTAIWLVVGLIVAMWVWAIALLGLGIFPALEPSLYFAMIAFTTLGFGDVLLPQEWRLLSGFIGRRRLYSVRAVYGLPVRGAQSLPGRDL